MIYGYKPPMTARSYPLVWLGMVVMLTVLPAECVATPIPEIKLPGIASVQRRFGKTISREYRRCLDEVTAVLNPKFRGDKKSNPPPAPIAQLYANAGATFSITDTRDFNGKVFEVMDVASSARQRLSQANRLMLLMNRAAGSNKRELERFLLNRLDIAIQELRARVYFLLGLCSTAIGRNMARNGHASYADQAVQVGVNDLWISAHLLKKAESSPSAYRKSYNNLDYRTVWNIRSRIFNIWEHFEKTGDRALIAKLSLSAIAAPVIEKATPAERATLAWLKRRSH